MHGHDITESANTPQLALVLGSGGVRSVAALGICDVLNAVGLKPDLVVGCSSGALFGACIAKGWTGDQGLEAAMRLWSADLTRKKRWRAFLEIFAPRFWRFGPDFALRDAALIRARVERAFGAVHIGELPVPLRVVATDASTGRRVVLRDGRLADAVRASMALPILFPSVEIGGRRLTDGVLSDPLPVSAALDARAIVTVGFRGSLPRRVDRVSRLVAQVTTTMINNLQEARLAAADGARMFHFELDIDRRIGLWETRAMPRIFEAGREAARQKLPEIIRLFSRSTTGLAA